MTRTRWSLLLCIVALPACSRSGELVVQAEIGRDTAGAPVGIDKLVIQLLPFNRDSIFDLLAEKAPTPEPPIPPDLLALQDSIARMRDLWTEAESSWNEVRDALVKLSEQLKTMDRRSREYAQGFRRFTELEPQERALARAKDLAFQQYDRLQKRYANRADSIRAVRVAWGDDAFARYGEIKDSLLKSLGREVYEDTTRRGGYAVFRAPAGRWYVYTRYELPLQELYFNLPVEIRPGTQDTLRLRRDAAQVRPLL